MMRKMPTGGTPGVVPRLFLDEGGTLLPFISQLFIIISFNCRFHNVYVCPCVGVYHKKREKCSLNFCGISGITLALIIKQSLTSASLYVSISRY